MPAVSGAHLALCAVLLCLPALHGSVLLTARNYKPWKLSQVSQFIWSQCDALTHPGQIDMLEVSPDPIPVPGDVNIAVVCSTNIPLASPLTLTLSLEKHILDFWVKVPCVDKLGSCTYDVCETLDTLFPPGEPCPEPLQTYGIPCHCPFNAGTYSVPSSNFVIPDITLPSWLESGHYRVKGVLSSDQGEVGCAKMELSIKSVSHHWWK